jgi:hypothetical protein
MKKGNNKSDTITFDGGQSIEEIMPNINTQYVYRAIKKTNSTGGVFDAITGRPIEIVEYKPYQNILLESAIIWDGSDGKPKGRRQIRYYDGCESIFVDEQPKDKETISAFQSATRQIHLQYGYVKVYGYETMLKYYMDICSYNANSPYRVPGAEAIFESVLTEKINEQIENELDVLDEAMSLAKSATDEKMVIHAKYLGISFYDDISGNEMPLKSVRINYRNYAKSQPKNFVDSYNDTTIEHKYLISNAIESGVINTTLVNGKALWGNGGGEICEIGSFTSTEGITQKILEYSQLKVGENFISQLKAVSK